MTTLARIIIGLSLALFVSSCAFDMSFGDGKKGNGEIAEDQREVSEEFSVISAQEGLDVYVTQANDFDILVEADENVIDLIGTDIKDGRLRIHTYENIGRATKKIYVSLPQVTGLHTSSGADLITKTTIETDKIELSASSGSDLQVMLEADEVDADCSSGADIKISGNANLFYVEASSGSDIKAREFEVKTCVADASSGADIKINVSENLTAEASSGADISYTGEANVKTKKSVSGSVYKN
ncbi:MAG: DUF2807 domain-containing protein [Bacteroidia bacterium]|nr:DUF2807 domain-containing protein [Bacteroidia bacterium]